MDDITETNCVIDSAAVHVLDNRQEKLVLADLPLDLTNDRIKFLRSHIVKSIEQSGIGMFNDRSSNEVSLCCEDIFAKPGEIAGCSQKLAQRLFGYMTPKTIKPGTLWTVLFGDAQSATRYLALLKMDDTESYRYRPAKRNGKRTINLLKLPHILPNPKMKLDKAAFVIPEEVTELQYELRVLDKTLPEEKVAGYFTEFLSFHAPQTNREKTRIFNGEVEKWIQEKRGELPPELQEQGLRDFKRTYLNTNPRIKVRRFAEAALGANHPKLRLSLMKHLRNAGLKDSQFDVEQSEWSKLSSKLVYRLKLGENTVEIKGEFDQFKAMVSITEPTANDPHYYATIKADKVEEVVK